VWLLFTDVSGQCISPIFEGRVFTLDLKGAGIGHSLLQLGFGLDDQGTVVQFLAGQEIFLVFTTSRPSRELPAHVDVVLGVKWLG
jgi:hypothetical protein